MASDPALEGKAELNETDDFYGTNGGFEYDVISARVGSKRTCGSREKVGYLISIAEMESGRKP